LIRVTRTMGFIDAKRINAPDRGRVQPRDGLMSKILAELGVGEVRITGMHKR
jgi:hypothetical protein